MIEVSQTKEQAYLPSVLEGNETTHVQGVELVHVQSMIRGMDGEDPLAHLEGLRANLASANVEGRGMSPITPIMYTRLIVPCVSISGSIVNMKVDKWDGEQKMFQLWWMCVKVWVNNMLTQGVGEIQVC